MALRVSVDTGGTFTDVVAIDDQSSNAFVTKTPSTPDDPSVALSAALAEVAGRLDARTGDLAMVVHGTTTATNAVVSNEFRGIGLIVTTGFRHILEIARQSVPDGYGNSFFWVKPPRLVPLHLVAEVDGRMDVRGTEVRPLDEDGVLRAVEQLRQRGVDRLGVCLLHAYANDLHERRLAEIVTRYHSDLLLSLSSVVLPEYREYERAMTTLLDVLVKPYCASYLRAAERQVRRGNPDCSFLVMQSNGGVTTASKAADKPVTMLLSGPAAGVQGAVHVARLSGFRDILTFDVGGTSTDVCVVRAGRPVLTSETVIEGYPVKVPMIDMATVGTGGGSVAWVDSHAFLKVGPASAGAEPGPISYGRGGHEPTVTDAALVLGRLPAALIGGGLTLRKDLALQGFESLGRRLGLPAEEAAAGVLEIAAANQVHGIRRVTVHKGIDPSTFCLVAFGGAGGMLATDVADFLGSPTILAPPNAGNLSAFGLQVSDIRRDLVRTFVRRQSALAADGDAEIVTAWRELVAAGQAELHDQGVPDPAISILLGADLRYAGQSYEVRVVFEADTGVDAAVTSMWDRFHLAHDREFGFSYAGEQDVELVNLRVQAVGRVGSPGATAPVIRPASTAAARGDGGPHREVRPAYWRATGWVDAAIVDRAGLRPGQRLAGPVIIEEYGSTVVVPVSWSATCDDAYNLLIERHPA